MRSCETEKRETRTGKKGNAEVSDEEYRKTSRRDEKGGRKETNRQTGRESEWKSEMR